MKILVLENKFALFKGGVHVYMGLDMTASINHTLHPCKMNINGNSSTDYIQLQESFYALLLE